MTARDIPDMLDYLNYKADRQSPSFDPARYGAKAAEFESRYWHERGSECGEEDCRQCYPRKPEPLGGVSWSGLRYSDFEED